jgi:hypothetical protein
MGLIQSSDTIVFRDVTAGDLISELVATKKVKGLKTIRIDYKNLLWISQVKQFAFRPSIPREFALDTQFE